MVVVVKVVELFLVLMFYFEFLKLKLKEKGPRIVLLHYGLWYRCEKSSVDAFLVTGDERRDVSHPLL